jgi:hypothetical protein
MLAGLSMKLKLSIYVGCVALGQLILYAKAYYDPRARWLFYFDPRIGLFFFESGLRGSTSPQFPALSSVVSAVILAAVGVGLVLEKLSVLTYLIVEALMTLPNLAFVGWIAMANLSPAHGFSVGELVLPAIVFAVASGFPLWFGVKIYRSAKPANTPLQPTVEKRGG